MNGPKQIHDQEGFLYKTGLRGVFKTLLSIYDGAYLRKQLAAFGP